MRSFLAAITICACLVGKAQSYPNYNISLLATIAPETTNNWYATNTKYAGCYGWVDPDDNTEYAILGTTKGNYFINLSDPANPTVADFVAGAAQNSLWREIKTYQNYAYLVSDDNGNKLQIVDMSYLPDSVHVVYNSNALFTKAHTLFIEGNKLYCGGITKPVGGTESMAVYDLSNPALPVLLRTLDTDYPSVGYVHDMFVRNDTVYASTGNPGLFIFKYNSNNTFTLLASYSNYLQAGYNHSSYLTPDSKTLVFCDEVPTGLCVKVLDVSDFGNLTLSDTIVSHPGATPHNPYVMDNYHAVISYYQDGVYIYDVSNANNAVLKGFFDTDPAHGNNDNYSSPDDYQGCWGAYAFLPSGILLASDMQNGLFILDPTQAVSVKKENTEQFIRFFPNPAKDLVNAVIKSDNIGLQKVIVRDITGKAIIEKVINKIESAFEFSIDTHQLSPGSYIVSIENNENIINSKLIISN